MFFLSDAIKKSRFQFERNAARPHVGRTPAVIHYYPSIIKRFLLRNASDCSADAFHGSDIFRTRCREHRNQRQRRPGGRETKVEEVLATRGPLAFDISVCVSRAGTKHTESHDLEFSAQTNKAFIYMH